MRLAMVQINGEDLERMLCTNPDPRVWSRVVGLPCDAKFIRMFIDNRNGGQIFYAVFEHESFPNVPSTDYALKRHFFSFQELYSSVAEMQELDELRKMAPAVPIFRESR